MIRLKRTTLLAAFMLFTLSLPVLVNAQGQSNRDNKKTEIEERVKERQEKAQLSADEKSLVRDERKAAKIQEACERRVAKIEQSMSRFTGLAQKKIKVIDSFHEKVQKFYESGQLTVRDFDELNEAVVDARLTAEIEVAALEELEVDIDCEDPEVVTSVRAYKATAIQAKDSLKAYRSSLVGLISAMRSAASQEDSQDDHTEESSNNEEESELDESEDN